MKELMKLSAGWQWTKLAEISDIILGQSPPSSTYNETRNGLPFYQGKLEFGNIYPTPQKWCTVSKKVAEKGDVLISVRAPVGPTNICPEKSCIGRGLAAIRPSGGIEALFILYFLRAFENSIAGKGTGTTFNAITGDQLRDFEVPLPPLPEQRRIVTKIEELFTKLDAGVSALKKTQAQLKRYRQSVLKAACEGKLVPTEAELTKGVVRPFEPVDVLLEKIKVEKEKLVKEGENQKRKPLTSIKSEEIPYELPKEWQWVRLEDLISLLGDGLHGTPKYSESGDYFFINGNNLSDGKIRINNGTKRASIEEYNRYKKKLDERTVLVSINGTLGNVAFYNNEKIILGKSACYFNLLHSINKFYMKLLINTTYFSEFASNNATGSTIKNLSLKSMRLFLVPLPPLAEQRRIVAEVERRLSVADEVARTVEQSLAQAQRLRQSILKKAFEGKLVVQNPEDEPAGVLLERIKAEKAHKGNGTKNRSK